MRRGSRFDSRCRCDQTLRHSGNARVAALDIIHLYCRLKHSQSTWTSRLPHGYVCDFPFDEVPYLFVSSQIRPNKNFFNLLKAYEFVLRRRYRNLKLVITGDLIAEGLGLKGLIHERGLDLDVVSLPNIPLDVHAAFYHLATLTIVPTLFEGGFPFQFSESMSVGTPVVMSDIAATRELLPDNLVERMLFDPTDPHSMAARIEWALDNCAALFDLQKPFYEDMQTRTWDKVANEYLEVFREVAAGSRNG